MISMISFCIIPCVTDLNRPEVLRMHCAHIRNCPLMKCVLQPKTFSADSLRSSLSAAACRTVRRWDRSRSRRVATGVCPVTHPWRCGCRIWKHRFPGNYLPKKADKAFLKSFASLLKIFFLLEMRYRFFTKRSSSKGRTFTFSERIFLARYIRLIPKA